MMVALKRNALQRPAHVAAAAEGDAGPAAYLESRIAEIDAFVDQQLRVDAQKAEKRRRLEAEARAPFAPPSFYA